jgi:DNA-binding XRE family transcriptional regulator
MRSSTGETKVALNPAGALLRQWRDMRGKTQLDLSLDAGVSQKHISFVESGRSTPSRQMLLDLAQALDVHGMLVPCRRCDRRGARTVCPGALFIRTGDAIAAELA